MVELAHTFGGIPRSFLRVFFSDMKSTFKPLSPYNGHGFTTIFLYYVGSTLIQHHVSAGMVLCAVYGPTIREYDLLIDILNCVIS